MIQPIQPPQRLLLHNVTWDAYSAILEALGDRPLRLTYDGRNLEIMAPSPFHEQSKHLLGRLIETYMDESGVDYCGAGSTTLRREVIDRGLEPDECYYIANEPAIRGKDQLDFDVDPPPDLAVEVDATHSSIDRMAVYARLGVPEVWRYAGGTLRVYRLAPGGEAGDEAGGEVEPTYEEVDRSPTLPGLAPAEVTELLQRRAETAESALIREFRQRIRDRPPKAT